MARYRVAISVVTVLAVSLIAASAAESQVPNCRSGYPGVGGLRDPERVYVHLNNQSVPDLSDQLYEAMAQWSTATDSNGQQLPFDFEWNDGGDPDIVVYVG